METIIYRQLRPKTKNVLIKAYPLIIVLFAYLSEQAVLAQDLTNISAVKPFTANGSFGLNSSFYSASGITDRQPPFAYGLNANATFTIYGVSLPVSFTWYNNTKKGSFIQPFNQFGLSPKYKWLTLHLGYRNISFSEFTLNGYTFLGTGIEARPGKWRLGAVYGKFNNNSSFNLAMADSIPKMTRLGWAAKVGYGTEKRFVDISVLRISDNAKNFSSKPLRQGMPTPEQNIAFGLTSRLEIAHNLQLTFDGSYSFFTKDKSMLPSDTINNKMLRLVSDFITVNKTSEYYKALKAGINYRFTQSIVSGIEYRRIDPGFRSMGSYFFNNDIEQITFNQSLGLLKNKINLRGSLGIQHDNLNKGKENTSKRIVTALSGNFNINQHWAIDGSYNNFSTNQQAFRTIGRDSLRVFQVNSTLNLMPRYIKVTPKMMHMVMLNLNSSTLEDKNKRTAAMTNTDTYMAMLMYNFSLFEMKLNLSTGVNYIEMKNKNFNSQIIGGNFNISKSFFKDNLSIGWNNNVMKNEMTSSAINNSGLALNSLLNTSFRFHPKHLISISLNIISNRFSNTTTNPSYNEKRGDISYVFNF